MTDSNVALDGGVIARIEKLNIGGTTEKCSNCKNLITPTNKLLRCFGCQKFFCETCEGWFRAERKRGEKPLCEKCYEKERVQREEKRKRELEEKKRKELEHLLVSETTLQNAVKKQQAWARKLGIDVGFTCPTGIEFILIPAGTFLMGSEYSSSSLSHPPHQVTLSKPFYLGKYQITQVQWQTIIGKNPSSFKGDTRPVEQVEWHDCQEFIRTLNSKEGTDNYRFPTEAEWEYACRAGTMTQFSFGDSLSSTQANFNGNYPFGDASKGPYLERTTDVGSYQPNAWGLYDMHGNVWEWCQDRLGDYPNRAVTDPHGSVSSPIRVIRGGGWYSDAESCASASRGFVIPDSRRRGFRLAKSL